jgi:hypothetical protein
MSHYARVENGIVKQVVVAEADFISSHVGTEPGEWIQTSYNTYGGVHRLGGTPLRYNFAAVGHLYNKEADAFYEVQPYPSWTLNTSKYIWEPPVDYPADGNRYSWNETDRSWDLID